ncbi:MAG: hypothetical protein ACPKM0_06580 [Pleomorphochaeta sp.]
MKKILILLAITIFASSFIFCTYDSYEYKIDFLNIEEQDALINLTIKNTENSFETEVLSGQKIIELTTISTDTNYLDQATPHINIENYKATLSDGTNSSTCTLLVKTTINYEYIDDETTWYLIDDAKTYIYNRTKLTELASSFDITLYYLIDNPNNILNTSGASDSFLTLDTGGATNYYLFYLDNYYDTEESFFSSSLSDSINLQATPESFIEVYDTYLQVNAQRPSSWTNSSFFNSPSSDNLEWEIYLQAILTDPLAETKDSSDSYYIGLQITSENNFILKSNSPGEGDKQLPYTLKVSKSDKKTHTVSNGDKYVVQKISAEELKQFNLYITTSSSNINDLNAGLFSDTIYLNFETTEDESYSNKKITVF